MKDATQLQLNEQGQLRHFLTTEGLSHDLLTEQHRRFLCQHISL